MAIDDYKSVSELTYLQERLQEQLLYCNRRLTEARASDNAKSAARQEAIAKCCADLKQAKELMAGCRALAAEHEFDLRIDFGPEDSLYYSDDYGDGWSTSSCGSTNGATDSGPRNDYGDEE